MTDAQQYFAERQLEELEQKELALSKALELLQSKHEEQRAFLKESPDVVNTIKMALDLIDEVNYPALLITPLLLEYMQKEAYPKDVQFGMGNDVADKERLRLSLYSTQRDLLHSISKSQEHVRLILEDIGKVEEQLALVKIKKEEVKASLD